MKTVVVPDPVCFLCGEPDPDYRADWLGNEYVHKDCDREAQRDEERRQCQHGHSASGQPRVAQEKP